jgi:cytochrome c553
MTAGCVSTASVSQAPRTALIAPGSELPPWMLPIVRAQMARRWQALNELRWSAASLEFERTHQLAGAMAHDVQCGHPADDNITVNQVIPAPYLEMQGELRLQALKLASAAQGNDFHVVEHAFHEMVQTCVRCHEVYRHQGRELAMPTISGR